MLIIYPARTKNIRVKGKTCIEYIIILSYTPDYIWQKLKYDDPIRITLSHSKRWPRLTNLQTKLTLSCMTIGFQSFTVHITKIYNFWPGWSCVCPVAGLGGH